MVEQEAVDGPVAPRDEVGLEAPRVQAAHAGFAAVAAAEELDDGVGVVGEEVDDLLVQALVEVVAVFVVELADFGFVCGGSVLALWCSGWVCGRMVCTLNLVQPLGEVVDLRLQLRYLIFGHDWK